VKNHAIEMNVSRENQGNGERNISRENLKSEMSYKPGEKFAILLFNKSEVR